VFLLARDVSTAEGVALSATMQLRCPPFFGGHSAIKMPCVILLQNCRQKRCVDDDISVVCILSDATADKEIKHQEILQFFTCNAYALMFITLNVQTFVLETSYLLCDETREHILKNNKCWIFIYGIYFIYKIQYQQSQHSFNPCFV
jgi:hypothetical protein